MIVDCRGRIISGTTLRKSVFADPKILPDKLGASRSVGNILDIDPAELAPGLIAAGDRRFFVIRRGVSEQQARTLREAGIHGLGIFTEPYRTYPMKQLGAGLIGFVSSDGVGVSGLEHQCDSWLSGENGIKTIVRDARRKAFWLADGGYRPARDGFHVILTIDAEVQAAVERELAEGVQQYEAESGVAIVMEPTTGAILAMANYPGFDPNHYGDYGANRYRNRAITDPYEPGSTFKPFVASAALQAGVVRLGEIFDCEMGEWHEGRRTLRDHHPFGFLTFEEVLIKSSNIGMGKIGKRLGNTHIHDCIRAFGFGEKTGIDIEGEDPGIVRPFSRWNEFSTISLPFGQEIAVTPLQLVRAFCVFANNGMLVRPFVIRAVMDVEGRAISDFTPPPSEIRVLPEEIVHTMKDKILCEVVNRSPPGRAQLTNYQVFGKTGTAQIAKKGGGGYEKNAYVSSFVGGAPARDPKMVVLVAIRRPNKAIGYYGGQVAAPVARDILGHALAYLQVPPDPPSPAQYTALQSDPFED